MTSRSGGSTRCWTSGSSTAYDTGLTVYHVVRVGRAVLLSYEYGEGNGSEQTRSLGPGSGDAAKADQPVVDAMAELVDAMLVGDAVALTPAMASSRSSSA